MKEPGIWYLGKGDEPMSIAAKTMYDYDPSYIPTTRREVIPVGKVVDMPYPIEENPLTRQVGGSHYKTGKVQAIEVVWDWDLPFELGSVLKYIQRHKSKGGAEDIKKAIHYLELYLERLEKST